MIYHYRQGVIDNKNKYLTWIAAAIAGLLLTVLLTATASAAINSVTPSTNDQNRDNNWAHFNVVDTRIGEVDIEFVQTRNFFSCFEYRIDGADTTDTRDNFNTDVTDGLWPFLCLNEAGTSETLTLEADEYVEIRSVFGAERDERFDWTRVDVLPDAQTKEDCKKGGWSDFNFRNQGQCIRFVNTGQDSR